MPKAEKSLIIIDHVAAGGSQGYLKVDPRSLILVSVVYLCFILGVPVTHIDILLWYALYPIISAPLFGLSYSSIFLQSLIVLPLVLLLGIFNPIIDKTVVIPYEGFAVTRGWLMFFGIVVRGLLSMQALLIMLRSIGFIGIVKGLGRLGVPKFLVTQLMMVFRYIRVLIEEAIVMKEARDARSFGVKHLSIKMWGILIGQLFLRSIDRAERIHNAMLSRGFTGSIPFNSTGNESWGWNSTLFLVIWSLLFLFLRLFNLSLLFVEHNA